MIVPFSFHPMHRSFFVLTLCVLTGCTNLGAAAGIGVSSIDLSGLGGSGMRLSSDVRVSPDYPHPLHPNSNLAVVVDTVTVAGDVNLLALAAAYDRPEAYRSLFIRQMPQAFETVQIAERDGGLRTLNAADLGGSGLVDGAQLEIPGFEADVVMWIHSLRLTSGVTEKGTPRRFARMTANVVLWDNEKGAPVASGVVEVGTLGEAEDLAPAFVIQLDRLTPMGGR